MGANPARSAMNFEEIAEGCVAYVPSFIQPELANQYFSKLKDVVAWRQEQINFGKDI